MASWKLLVTSGSSPAFSGLSLDSPLTVPNGGTGQVTLSSDEVLLGNGVGAITSVARGDIADAGNGKIIVTDGSSSILGTGVTLDIGGNIASGSNLNDISLLSSADGNFIVGSATGWVVESDSTVRSSLGLGTGDDVTFNIVSASIHSGSFVGDGSQLTGLSSAAINSYTNANDNSIITSVDASTVNAEANLTFDGSTLVITGNVSSSLAYTGSGLNLSGLSAGVDNTVLVLDSNNNVVTDEIDSRVWGTSLVDGSGAATRIAFWSDADTLTSDSNLSFASNVLTIDGSTFGENVVIAGNLTVNGDTVTENVANVNIEDKFVLLGSGSSSGDAGFVFQTETNFSGSAFGWDDSTSRLAMQIDTKFSPVATTMTPDAYVAAVVDVDGGQTDVAAHQLNGNIKIEGGNIYIYS